jgi:pyruvate/2-oxoglutarate/acetoin dehydrogenase E1 component
MQIEREGSDITLVSFSKMVGFCLKAAEELEKDGISAEVGLLSTSVEPSLSASLLWAPSVRATGCQFGCRFDSIFSWALK